MKPENELEQRLEMLAEAVGRRDSFVADVMSRIENSPVPMGMKTNRHFVFRRILMKKSFQLAAAACIAVAAFLALTQLDTTVTPAYALEQTVRQFETVRHLHLVRHDDAGAIEEERWIEINPDGSQGRYRQDTSGELLVVDDGETRFIYRRDKNAVLLYGKDGPRYTWIANLYGFFRDMADDDSVVVEENTDWRGRRAHAAIWRKLNVTCHIDPETKLPIGLGRDEIRYDPLPEGIFEIPEAPAAASVYDFRPGAEPVKAPAWLQDEEQAQQVFDEAREALANGEYAKAVEKFQEVFQLEGTGRNWAWFWMGEAYRAQGRHHAAVECYTRVIDIFSPYHLTPHYAFLARGTCRRLLGDEAAAWEDLRVALPMMIEALENVKSAEMFDYADDPLHRSDELSDQERFERMLTRLREAAGEDVAAGAQTKAEAVAAWQAWWKDLAAR